MALGIPAKIREGYEVPQGHIDLNTTMYFENGSTTARTCRLD